MSSSDTPTSSIESAIRTRVDRVEEAVVAGRDDPRPEKRSTMSFVVPAQARAPLRSSDSRRSRPVERDRLEQALERDVADRLELETVTVRVANDLLADEHLARARVAHDSGRR